MEVTFDKYSLMVNGKRVFIKSGAFHYFRTPGEDMARDRFMKMKALDYILNKDSQLIYAIKLLNNQ